MTTDTIEKTRQLIKTAFITPTAYLERFASQSNYHLALGHRVLEDSVYAGFYRSRSEQGDFVICDNSVFELGKPLETPDLLEAARRIGANELVCPDALFNGAETIKSHSKFISDLYTLTTPEEENRLGLMGVAQGRDLEDYLDCFSWLNNHPHITTIGLSFVGLEKVLPDVSTTLRRLVILDVLENKGLSSKKPIHLLGIGDNPLELKFIGEYNTKATIRGNDSSSAFVHGARKIAFDEKKGLSQKKIQEKINLSANDLDTEALNTVQHNIYVIQNWMLNL